MRFDSFSHMLRYWAEKQPAHPALVYDEGGRKELSFSALEEAVEKRAEALKADGGSCVGILADGSKDCVVEIFAAARAGLQIVLLDAALPEAVLPALLRYTDADRLWGVEDLCEELKPAITGGVKQPHVIDSEKCTRCGTCISNCKFGAIMIR